MKARFLCIVFVCVLAAPAGSNGGEPASLWNIVTLLQSKRFVDLTHAFYPGIPHWPGFDDEELTVTYHYEKRAGKNLGMSDA